MPYRLTLTKRNHEVREIEYQSRKLAVAHFQKSSYGQSVLCAVLEKCNIGGLVSDPAWIRIARMDLTENSGGEGMVNRNGVSRYEPEGRRSLVPRALSATPNGDGVALGGWNIRDETGVFHPEEPNEMNDRYSRGEEMPF